jgi:hypothetical protein
LERFSWRRYSAVVARAAKTGPPLQHLARRTKVHCLFTHTTESGSLRQAAGDGFTLTLRGTASTLTVFSVVEFLDRWAERGFEGDPPNAALVLDSEPDDSDTLVLELSSPSFDEDADALSYSAQPVQGEAAGGSPEDDASDFSGHFSGAHLFIDPGETGGSRTVAVATDSPGTLRLSFDQPWSVVVESGQDMLVTAPGQAAFEPGSVTIQIPTQLRIPESMVEFSVAGGSGAVTGTAQWTGGPDATISFDGGRPEPLRSGDFSSGG